MEISEVLDYRNGVIELSPIFLFEYEERQTMAKWQDALAHRQQHGKSMEGSVEGVTL